MKSIGSLPIATLCIATLPIAVASSPDAQQPTHYPNPGTYGFAPPVDGYWKFIIWGGGGNGSAGVTSGGSGAYVEVIRHLTTADTVTVIVGDARADSSVTFPDGRTATAGAGSGGTGGTATGGDVNLNGSAGVAPGGLPGNHGLGTGGGAGGPGTVGSGGAGAPANLPYRGADGGGSHAGIGPGAGTIDGGTLNAGPGYAIATFLRA
jgi:hypothetical protein